MTTAILKPAPGARVRFPNNPQRLLKEDGDRVELDSAWRRLIKAGDVEVVEDAPPPPEGGEGEGGARSARLTKRTAGDE
jgi:hypothetical protein